MSKEIREQIDKIKNFVLKENSTPEYDSILDIYNRRKDKMSPYEMSFFKSGGKEGSNPMYHISEEISSRFEHLMDYLDNNNINWEWKDSWGGGIGFFQYISIERKEGLENYINKLFSGIKTSPVFPNWAAKDYTDENKINVHLHDPKWYDDIISTPIKNPDDIGGGLKTTGDIDKWMNYEVDDDDKKDDDDDDDDGWIFGWTDNPDDLGDL